MPPYDAPALTSLDALLVPDIIGQTLVKDAVVYTPWMPTLGDAATIAVEVIGRATNAGLTVAVQHKKLDQTDAEATTETTTISGSTVDVHKDRYAGLKQLFRLKFTASGSAALDWTHLRMLEPAWERNGIAVPATSIIRAVPQPILGRTLFKGLTVYTGWSATRGNNATFVLQGMAISGATVTTTIQTKQADATDAAGNISDLTNTIALSTATVGYARNTDVKELWRMKHVVTGSNAYDWIHVRALVPVWERS